VSTADSGPPITGLVAVLGGLFMIAVDVSIINVASPRIREDLDLSGSALVFAVSGYTLAYAMLLITGARLGDDHGHRRVFLTGLVGFSASSLVCGVAPSAAVLIVARVVQGAAGALMGPQVLSIIQTQFTGDLQRRGVALYATVLAAGTGAGQIAGGIIVTAGALGSSWRAAFLINVPIGATLAVVTIRHLTESRGVAPRALDVGGVALVSATVLTVVSPLVFGQEHDWPPWTYLSLVVGAVLLVATISYMRRRTKTGRDALVDMAFFHSTGARWGLAALLAMQVTYGGFCSPSRFMCRRAWGSPRCDPGSPSRPSLRRSS
jgi:MFS family permease